jgi:hypothetical protein
LIAQFEQELEQLRQQVRQLATDKAALEQVCSNTQATLAGRTWRARLDRLLGRGLV